jgi:hypothetical protein
MSPYIYHKITKKTCCSTAQESYEICNQPVGNKILNIKPCISQISGTWELLLVDTCRSTWTHYSDSDSYSLVLRA